MTKALIGVLIGGAAAVVAAYVVKKKEKKYAEIQSSEKEENEEEPSEIKEKMAEAAKKMVKWVLSHKDEIEAATVVLGLVSACLNFKNKVVEGRNAVIKKPTRSDFQKDLGGMTADQALDHVKETRKPLLIVDDDKFGYVISPEVAA